MAEADLRDAYPKTVDDLAIWWTDATDCNTMMSVDTTTWPEIPSYIRQEYSYRMGRFGGGRLWVSREHGIMDACPDTIDFPRDNLLALRAEKCGGIVILKADASLLRPFPGFVTDRAFVRL